MISTANYLSCSFVPADGAELGITDKILTKINTQESVSKVYNHDALGPITNIDNFRSKAHL